MARSVVFETPGLIDIRAFTILGINSKPNSSSPIGYFGTGLKYAIAVLVRNKHPVTVWIGRTEYFFEIKTEQFRDKDFDFIQMRERKWHPRKMLWLRPKFTMLPFTTEFGKTWELWQAFRELESNTRDENGSTYISSIGDVEQKPDDRKTTKIVVEGEDFVQEYLNREKTFLPDGLTQQVGTDELQVFERPSNHVYYRGMRVFDLPKPAQFTYNILRRIELTEDRTAKWTHEIEAIIARFVSRSQDREFIVKQLTAPTPTFESGINYAYNYSAPDSVFVEEGTKKSVTNPTARVYAKSYQPQPPEKPTEEYFKDHPRPWKLIGVEFYDSIVDQNGEVVLTFPQGLSKEMKQIILDACNNCKPQPKPIEEEHPIVPDTLEDSEILF